MIENLILCRLSQNSLYFSFYLLYPRFQLLLYKYTWECVCQDLLYSWEKMIHCFYLDFFFFFCSIVYIDHVVSVLLTYEDQDH